MQSENAGVSVEAKKNRVTLSVTPDAYPMDAIYGASFVYTDRAYVLLDRADERYVTVTLTARNKMDKKALEALGGQFANELLTQTLRDTISKKTVKIRELIINRALYSTLDSGDPGGDVFDEDDDLEFLDDPLGIAVPWEEKFEGEGDTAAGEGDASAESADALDDDLDLGDDPLSIGTPWEESEAAPADDKKSEEGEG